jgi:hypothetical protein
MLNVCAAHRAECPDAQHTTGSLRRRRQRGKFFLFSPRVRCCRRARSLSRSRAATARSSRACTRPSSSRASTTATSSAGRRTGRASRRATRTLCACASRAAWALCIHEVTASIQPASFVGARRLCAACAGDRSLRGTESRALRAVQAGPSGQDRGDAGALLLGSALCISPAQKPLHCDSACFAGDAAIHLICWVNSSFGASLKAPGLAAAFHSHRPRAGGRLFRVHRLGRGARD